MAATSPYSVAFAVRMASPCRRRDVVGVGEADRSEHFRGGRLGRLEHSAA
ncbi:MAG: hypothetical protein ACRDPY_16185 [Streptosporangiaceae bacterium]